MRFLFDCENEVCLPAAYRLVDEIKPYLEKVRDVEIDGEKIIDKKQAFAKILENVMVKYPGETGHLLSKMWILEPGETAPNAFKTLAALFNSEVATDFFTSVLPSLLQISKELSPLLK